MADLTQLDTGMTRATTEAGKKGEQAGEAYTRGRDGKLRDARGRFIKEVDDQGETATRAFRKHGENAGRGWGQTARSMMAATLGTFTAIGVVGLFKSIISEARESQVVGALTTQVIRSTGSAAHVTAQQVGTLAMAISNKTGVDDEAVQSASNLLLTFTGLRNEVGKGNDVFNQATQAAVDMAAALGGDPKNAALQLGKALNDPTQGMNALRRAGVSFSAEQQKTIKSMQAGGNILGAQKLILAELSKEFGGAAAAASTGGQKFSTVFSNFKEAIGTALLPTIDRVLGGLTTVVGNLTTHVGPAFATIGRIIRDDAAPPIAAIAGTVRDYLQPALRNTAEYVRANVLPALASFGRFLRDDIEPAARVAARVFGEVLGSALRGFGNWVRDNQPVVKTFLGVIAGLVIPFQALKLAIAGWAVVTRLAAAAQLAFNAALGLSPLTLVVVGIAALAAGVVYAYTHFKPFRDVVDAVGRFLRGVFLGALHAAITGFRDLTGAVQAVGGWFARMYRDVTGFVTRMWRDVTGLFRRIWADIRAVVGGIVGFVRDHWRLLISIVLGPLGVIIVLVTDHWRQILGVFTRAINAVTGFVSRLWRDVTGFFSRMWRDVSGFVSRIWRDVTGFFRRIAADVAGVVGRFIAAEIRGWQNLWRQITGFVTRIWRDVLGFFQRIAADVWGVVKPWVDRIVGAFTSLWHQAWDIAGKIHRGVVDFFVKLKDGVVSAFNGVVSAASSAWNKVKDIIAAPIRWVVENVYDKGIVGIWNAIAGVLHEPGLRLDAIHFAEGGVVPGSRAAGDNVPIFATAGEGVVNLRGMSILGPDGLAALNGSSGVGGDHFAGGGVIGALGSVVSAVGGAVSSAVSGLAGLVRGALASTVTPLIHAAESGADATLGGMGPVGQMMDHLVHMLGDKILAWVAGDDKKTISSIVASVGGDHAQLILKALTLAGVPVTPGNVADVDMIVKFESGWNANAINLTDSNAQAGHPSQGLMQTIPSTFAAYAIPGLGGITDPIANLVAGIRYAVSRYGSLDGVPGVQAVHAGGSYVGYDTGGLLQPGYTLAYNGTGRDEHVLTNRQLAALKGGNVHVYPRAGQSEYEIGVIAARELAWAARMP